MNSHRQVVLELVDFVVWRDVLTTICRSEYLTVPPLVGCCRWNHIVSVAHHDGLFVNGVDDCLDDEIDGRTENFS